jgi:parallel beta-helix repeat protein
MTVSVHDDRRRGFYETFARITWIDGGWVGLDHGIEADYQAGEEPRLTTAHPMIFGHGIANASVRHLTLEGERENQEIPMGGCRGAAVYFARSRNIEVTGVRERNYDGEGLGFQMCRDMVVRDCRVLENTGNGLHPGAGSTNCLIERCQGSRNGKSGFYFCVRANRITVRDCTFEGNGNGVSIGTRDCHNLIESCRIAANRGPGVLLRDAPAPTEVHSCRIRGCRIEGNASEEGEAQLVVLGDAHDIAIEDNDIAGAAGRPLPGISVAKSARSIYCHGNRMDGCRPPIEADAATAVNEAPMFASGYGTYGDEVFRHLP